MAPRPFAELDLSGRRVFLRAALDVPLTPAGGIANTDLLDESLPTMRAALDKGARLIIAAHLGNPGRPDPALSLEPIGAFLAEKLNRDVLFTDEPAGDGARKVVSDLREGQVALLENLRFSSGEDANEERFARALAGYADVYVNDAFDTVHRTTASGVGMVRHVSERGIGFSFARELAQLEKLVASVERPMAVIVGGTHLTAKLRLLERLLDRIDAIFAGGAVGCSLLMAKGGHLGRSLVEEDKLATARSFLRRTLDLEIPVHLPRDHVAAAGLRAGSGKVVPANDVPDDLAALDIGPDTVRAFCEELKHARTVLWVGPMGACEIETFSTGTLEIARAIARLPVATTVAIGRETTAAIRTANLTERFSHVSSGGDAAIAFIEGRELPGLLALEN